MQYTKLLQRSSATTRQLAMARMSTSTNASAVPIGMRSIPAIFARGGTSNGLVLWKKDLPPSAQCM